MQIFGEMKKGSIARKLAYAGIKLTRGSVQQPGGPGGFIPQHSIAPIFPLYKC